jgi:hypothetical protein
MLTKWKEVEGKRLFQCRSFHKLKTPLPIRAFEYFDSAFAFSKCLGERVGKIPGVSSRVFEAMCPTMPFLV